MGKFEESMDEYVADIDGMPLRRRHTMSLPRIDFIRRVFDDIYQRGYDRAMQDRLDAASSRRKQ